MLEKATEHACITRTNPRGLSVRDVYCIRCLCANACRTCVPVCARACAWCMTQWVSWVCWWCLPELQRGWRFSTNPASLEGLLILTTQCFPCILLLYQRGGMREKQVHRLFTKFALADRNKPSHFPLRGIMQILHQHLNVMHPPALCYPPFVSPFCHLVSFWLPFFPLSSLAFYPSLCSAAPLTSAAREPSVLLSATNRHRQIKKHHCPINSPACLC